MFYLPAGLCGDLSLKQRSLYRRQEKNPCYRGFFSSHIDKFILLIFYYTDDLPRVAVSQEHWET